MAAIATQVISDAIENISTENSICKNRSETVSEALVALPSINTDSDSGILTCNTNNSSELEQKTSQLTEEGLTGKANQHEDELSQEQSTLFFNNRCSQDSRTSSCTTETNFSSVSKNSQSATSGHVNENSTSSCNSTVKENQKISNESEDSHSSISSSASVVKTSQYITYKSDTESDLTSIFKSQNKKNSPEKPIRNKSRPQRNQIDMDDDDSSSVTTSLSNTASNKSSQSVASKSDDESDTKSSLQTISKNNSPEKENDIKSNRVKKFFNIIDSDSEDDIVVSQTYKTYMEHKELDSDGSKSSKSLKSGNEQKVRNKKKSIDSDSDNKSIETNENFDKKETDSETSHMNSEKKEKSVDKLNKISNIVDSDSESGSENQYDQKCNISSGEENGNENAKKKDKFAKKRLGSARASKDAAMQQIHSETQRLIRETEITLPYHRPKQRTLQEFLNRKRIKSDIPTNLTFAEKVKMFPEAISKVVQEKEEEAEIFYKSSDSEEERDEAATTKNSHKEKSNIDTANNIVDTQKLIMQDHIQDPHDKMTVLQRRSLDLGVPRKLFSEEIDKNDEVSTNLSVSKAYINADKSINTDKVILESKLKEDEFGIRKASDSEKLFTGEEMDVDTDMKKEMIMVDSIHKTISKNSNDILVLNNFETANNSNSIQRMLDSSSIENTTKASAESSMKKVMTEEKKSSGKDQLKDSEDLILNLDSESKNDNGDNNEILDFNILHADFTLPTDLDESVIKRRSTKEIVLANVLKNKPSIKALPGSVIDFTCNSAQMKEGVTQLLDRFARHSVVYRPNINEISEIKTIRTEGTGNDVSIVEEILPFSKKIMDDDPKRDRKPGERLKKLREDLKRRIASVRNMEWKKKEEQDKENEMEKVKCIDDDFYEGLPDEEEELEDEVSTESEPEEDDVPMKESRRLKCAFGDEEAEESDDGNDRDFDSNEIDTEEEEKEEEEEEQEEEVEEEEAEEEEEQEYEKKVNNNKPKKLKRIIRPFDEDSNESKSSLSNDAKPKLISISNRVRSKTDEDMFASQTSNGSDDLETDSIPPFQSRDRCGSDARSQACKTPLPKPNNLLSMVSPITQLTALNFSRDSAKKSASKTPNALNLGPIDDSVENTPTENSANRLQTSCNMEKMISLQKKLFEDPPESVNEDELLEICSGRFTPSSERPPNISQNGVTDSQLMELCSGAFASQPVDMKKLESKNTCFSKPSFIDETSQDITLTLDDDEDSKSSPTKTVSSLKRSDESMFSSDSKSPVKLSTFTGTNFKNPMEVWLKKGIDKSTTDTQTKSDQVTDSQLLDLCSGPFTSQAGNLKELEKNDSPQIHDEATQDFNLTIDDNTKSPFEPISQCKDLKLTEHIEKFTVMDDYSNVPKTTFGIVYSSDEEDGDAKKKRPKKKRMKKKKVKKLTLSDDEDEDENKEFSDSEKSELDEEEDEEKFIDYDSEENEVVVVAKNEIKKVAKNFLENEAELSESDWDSADEDEQGMDNFDFEEGDAEEIDEDKMKEQLDRVHMKQVMDDDRREVKMLQELLFDDGDLHSEGAGRERKFKWKNIDSLGDLDLTPRTNENGEEMDDDFDTEVEAHMRKMRYEQQKFLEEKQKSLDVAINEDFSESQLFNRGLKVVTVRSSSKTSIEEQKLIKSNSVGNSTNILMMNGVTRGTMKKSFSSTKSLSFSNMKGSFLSRGDETLVRIAQNLPETRKIPANVGRKGNFVFQHLSPSLSNAPQDDSEQEKDSTPAKEKNKRKRKMFASQSSGQTPRSTKKLKVDDRAGGKKLF